MGRAYDDNLGEAMNRAIRSCNSGCGTYGWSCNRDVSVIVFDRGHHWATYTGRFLEEARHRAREICGRDCEGFVSASGRE